MRVDVGRRNLVTAALGRSMVPGVPATKRMRFRIGAMAIPSLITMSCSSSATRAGSASTIPSRGGFRTTQRQIGSR